MRADELRDALVAVQGVASAQVTQANGHTPRVRIVLDGTRSDSDVSRDISQVLDDTGLRTGGVVDTDPPSPVPVAADTTTEPTSQADRDLKVVPSSLASVSVEEGIAGVSVRIVSDTGEEAVERVGAGTTGMDRAVVGAVSRLNGVALPEIVSIDQRDVGGDAVVLVVLEDPQGRRAAGSSIVTGGRPFAVAKAAQSAVTDLR